MELLLRRLCPAKRATPIKAAPEWSQGLLIFPGSTCSFNSIPYLRYKIGGGALAVVEPLMVASAIVAS